MRRQVGLVFVEIDYRHETPSTFTGVGDFPYRIVVVDPRPDFWDGSDVLKGQHIKKPSKKWGIEAG